MAGRKIRDAADARARLKAMKAARGVSHAQWAREHGIDGRSLTAWRINLGRAAPSRPRQARLVELVATPAGSLAGPARYVVLCGKLSVEVDGSFEEATLLRLLRVVASC